MSTSVIQLKCNCNDYPWGKVGRQSLAATLCEKTPGTDFKLKEDSPYSEMWMGDNMIMPAKALSTGEPLKDILYANQEALVGKTVLDKFGPDLPFLPKILSAGKALPLQLHPDKALAEKLHKENPDKYPDANHKPEIAVALGKFELFVSFKPLGDIHALMQLQPLKQYCPEGTFNKEALKQVCKTLLEADPKTVASIQEGLGSLSKSDYGEKQSYILDLLPRMQKQYSQEDNGTLIALVCMNYMTVEAGACVYVPADGIHSWFAGDIVECMASSNNVLNVGFCPRASRDSVDLFVNALTFNPQPGENTLVPTKPFDRSKEGKTVLYAPPMSEFNILKTELKGSETDVVGAIKGPSVLWVTSGSGSMVVNSNPTDLAEGYVFFIGQGVECEFQTMSGLVAYRAYAE